MADTASTNVRVLKAESRSVGSVIQTSSHFLSISDIPAPLALVDETGVIVEANQAFRTVEAQLAFKDGFQDALRDLRANRRSEPPRRVLEVAGQVVVLETTDTVPKGGAVPVYVSVFSAKEIATHGPLAELCDLVWACDEEGRLRDLSTDSVRLLGHPPAVYRGRLLSELFEAPGEDRLERIPAFVKRAGFRNIDVRVRQADGTARWLTLAGVPRFGSEGGYTGHVGVAFDVTARCEAENDLRATQRRMKTSARALKKSQVELQVALATARQSERLKANFLANLNHEFRTPLNAIIGIGEMFALGLAGKDPDNTRENGERVAQAGHRLAALFDDVVAMSCIESADVDLDAVEFEVHSTLSEVLAEVRHSAAAHGRDASGIAELPATAVFADPGLTKRVLSCILDNAVKFTPAGARIGLQASVNKAAGALSLVVWDEGPGVSPERVEAIFEPFGRGQGDEFVASTGGTGIGLALARAYARLQGGDVDLERTGPRGSRFRFTLPLASG